MGNQVTVEDFVSVIGGPVDKRYSIADGGRIISTVPPGCWGPMITPELYSGHEVTKPVYVEGAAVGDALVLSIEKIEVVSEAAASGTDEPNIKYFTGDPGVWARCPHCNIHNPATYLEGIGDGAVKCKRCGRPVKPYTLTNGYTVAISRDKKLGVAVGKEAAGAIAGKTARGEYRAPEGSGQHLATIFGRSDFSGLLIRAFPMVGNIGCSPAKRMPASKNAGDAYESITKTPLFESSTKEEISDGHLDIHLVGEGSLLISPVLVEGAGVYFGDVHFTQGAGELAGHTLDICARVEVRVQVLKGLRLAGPIIIPNVKELNPRFHPFSDDEYRKAGELMAQYNEELSEKSYPLIFVGSGGNLTGAITNAVERAAGLTGLAREEIMNRATVGGEVGIGRIKGVAFLTLHLGEAILGEIGLLGIVKGHYGI